MSLKEKVLEKLIGGATVSGQQLADEFAVSRNAVWKAVRQLKTEGFEIKSVTNSGYSLLSTPDVPSASVIKSFLKSEIRVEYFDIIDSTNNEAKRLCGSGGETDTLIVSSEQTAGRGRRGRSFYSPNKTGVYFSLLRKTDKNFSDAVRVTTKAAVCIAKAIENQTDVKVGIKWVNDLYIGQSKICGILCEAVTDFETMAVSDIIVGIGVNITTENFPDDIKNKAGSVGMKLDKNRLVADAVNLLYKDFDYMENYRERSIVLGKKITYIKNGEEHSAVATAVLDDGTLEVKENGELHILSSGEISIKL